MASLCILQKNGNAIIETGLGSVFVQNKLREKIQNLYYMPNYIYTHTRMHTHISVELICCTTLLIHYVFLHILGGELRGSMGKFPK